MKCMQAYKGLLIIGTGEYEVLMKALEIYEFFCEKSKHDTGDDFMYLNSLRDKIYKNIVFQNVVLDHF